MTAILQLEQVSIVDHQNTTIIQPLSLTLQANRTMALVGESGSGKTLLSKAILNLLPKNLKSLGQIRFNGKIFEKNTALSWQKQRGKNIGLIMQDAMNAFNPLLTVGQQCVETLQFHLLLNRKGCWQLMCEQLERVRLTPAEILLKRYPNQLSGGQLQRIMIALTFALKPQLIIADEPTSALDSLNQFEVLNLFQEMRQQQNYTLLFITHNLGVVRQIADDVAVMQQGKLLEVQSQHNFFAHPQHPYSQFLLKNYQQLRAPFIKLMEQTDAINR